MARTGDDKIGKQSRQAYNARGRKPNRPNYGTAVNKPAYPIRKSWKGDILSGTSDMSPMGPPRSPGHAGQPITYTNERETRNISPRGHVSNVTRNPVFDLKRAAKSRLSRNR